MKYDLNELERLCDAATAGPWRSSNPHGDEYFRVVSCAPNGRMLGDKIAFMAINNKSKDDAALIAEARTAIPELIAEVRRLREKIGEE